MAQEHGVRFIPHGWNTAVGLAADLQLASAFADTDLVEYLTGSPYVDEIVGEVVPRRRRHAGDPQRPRPGPRTRPRRPGALHGGRGAVSLLGIDVGTTGCKAVVFSEAGAALCSAYAEYDFASPAPGEAELDSPGVWAAIKEAIRRAADGARNDPVSALSVCSLGEAVVPVSRDREILGPSLLGFDCRGGDLLEGIAALRDREAFYRTNGNAPGGNYGLTKLLWIRSRSPALYERAHKFLPWGSFVAFMLGGEAVVDYSLANRLLLFDLQRRDWSDELLEATRVDRDKLPRAAACGTVCGQISRAAAAETGLPPGTTIIVGAHDQCANALGSGVIEAGQAMFGMGTYPCIVPVFDRLQAPAAMLARGLNTEHHAVAGRYVTFIYNQGGSIIKWFRDTFAAAEKRQDVYDRLNAELGEGPGRVLVLPHWSVMGPPRFEADSCGAIIGLDLGTSRADILRGIIEGITFSLRESVDSLPGTEIRIGDFRAVGGGSRSEAWMQATADILGRPAVRLRVPEAGALGMAMSAGVATGAFASLARGRERDGAGGRALRARRAEGRALRRALRPVQGDLAAGRGFPAQAARKQRPARVALTRRRD